MAQALIRKLNDETLADYRRHAQERGVSLEAELRELIETHRPLRGKSRDELLALSEKACAMTIGGISSDSTPYIRRVRDTNGGGSEGALG